MLNIESIRRDPALSTNALQPRSSPGVPLTAIAVFAGYYLGATFGFAFTFLPNPISVLWPPNAILFGAFLLVPGRSWWVLIAAALPAHFLAELQSGVPVSMVVSWFVTNVSEALIGASIVRLLIRERLTFGKTREVVAFIFAACGAAFLSCFLDSALVLLNGWAGTKTFWQLWSTRLFSNVTASLTIVPMIVTWATRAFPAPGPISRERAPEAVALFVGLVVTGILVFDSRIIVSGSAGLLYIPLPWLLWAALRFGPAGASTALTTVALLAIFGSGQGLGALGARSAAENASAVQWFLIFISPIMMILAAIAEERRRAVTLLRTSEQRFSRAFRSGPDAMFITRRLDGRIVEVNDQWERLLGYSRREVVGRAVHDLGIYVGAESQGKFEAHSTVQGGQPRLEIDMRTKAGAILHAALAIEAAEIDEEPCLITNLRDITDRKRAEDALRESSERLRLALEAGRMGVWDWDKRSGGLTWSKEHFDIYGMPFSQTVTYEAWASRVHPDDLVHARAAMDAAIAARTEYQQEYRVNLPDGSIRWVESRAEPQFDDSGQCTRMMGLTLDISERKKAEERDQKLLHASRLTAMGELTASIAHEINQPVTSIMSNVDAAEMILASSPPDMGELREILRDIRSDDLRVRDIVRHVRGLANDRATEIELLDVNELIRAVLRLIAPTARRRKVKPRSDLRDLPSVHGDPIHFQQILLNLALNAMDAMSESPEEQRSLLVSSYAIDSATVQVSVRDCGQGIPPELHHSIFDSFVTTKKDGMGLGLSITRTLVEAQGGRIWSENNADRGATFHFTLAAGRDAHVDRLPASVAHP
jgi:PAS domain S-box-containing protein